jgi:hypothetical protein
MLALPLRCDGISLHYSIAYDDAFASSEEGVGRVTGQRKELLEDSKA